MKNKHMKIKINTGNISHFKLSVVTINSLNTGPLVRRCGEVLLFCGCELNVRNVIAIGETSVISVVFE